eukprot:358013-Chlamydomonas_euryale.AAC.4
MCACCVEKLCCVALHARVWCRGWWATSQPALRVQSAHPRLPGQAARTARTDYPPMLFVQAAHPGLLAQAAHPGLPGQAARTGHPRTLFVQAAQPGLPAQAAHPGLPGQAARTGHPR